MKSWNITYLLAHSPWMPQFLFNSAMTNVLTIKYVSRTNTTRILWPKRITGSLPMIVYAFWLSMSFKVIDFCCNRKPICDLLLVIDCNLSFVFHCFRDKALRCPTPTTPSYNLSAQSRDSASYFVVHVTVIKGETMCCISVKSSWF